MIVDVDGVRVRNLLTRGFGEKGTGSQGRCA